MHRKILEVETFPPVLLTKLGIIIFSELWYPNFTRGAIAVLDYDQRKMAGLRHLLWAVAPRQKGGSILLYGKMFPDLVSLEFGWFCCCFFPHALLFS